MRRALLLLGASLVMSLVFAQAAMGQTNSSGDCSVLAEQQGAPESFFAYIPEVNGCIAAEGLQNPTIDTANLVVSDADTGEELGVFKDVVDLSDFQTTETYCGAFPLTDGTTAQNYHDGIIQGEGVQNVSGGIANAQEQALLDPNGDGVACTAEDLSLAPGEMAVGDVEGNSLTPVVADQYADDDMADLPDTGGPSAFTLVVGVGLVGFGILLYRTLRRT